MIQFNSYISGRLMGLSRQESLSVPFLLKEPLILERTIRGQVEWERT